VQAEQVVLVESVEYYLLVKINDILDKLYPVQANFEGSFDEISDHLKK
jgi:hypothetical protein